jgi:hypothetical protein
MNSINRMNPVTAAACERISETWEKALSHTAIFILAVLGSFIYDAGSAI